MTQRPTIEVPTTLCDEDGNVTGETVFTLVPPHCKRIDTSLDRQVRRMTSEAEALRAELAFWQAEKARREAAL